MKKLVLFAAALVSLVACNKEEAVSADSFVKGQKVTLTVSGPSTTKVTSALNGDAVDFKWESGDQIKVTVAGQPANFTLTSGAGESSATFEGAMPAGGSTFDVQYPVDAPSIAEQAYSSSEAIPHDKMLLAATGCDLSSKSFTLQGQNAVLGLNLWGTDVTISKIVVTNTTSSATYTLNISGGKVLSTSSASPTPFFVVVPAGDWNFSADVYNNADTPAKICTLTKTSTDKYFTTAQVLNMPVKEISKLPVLLPGKFSVSATKKVQFTRGNLYYSSTDSKYHIEQNQNVTYLSTQSGSTYTQSHVTNFFWANTTDWQTSDKEPWAKSYSGTASDADKFFCGIDNPMTVDGQSDLYALTGANGATSGEWEYLLKGRTNASNLYRYGVTVTTAAGTANNCLVIAPDKCLNGYTFDKTKDTYTAADWATAESAGLVCLPAAGYRNNGGNMAEANNRGLYWSATPYSGSNGSIYYLNFYSSQIQFINSVRTYGYSIRLVHDAEKRAYEAVDLGLSVNWATYNIGATNPEEYGAYFGYGDVQGQTWNGSSWSGYGFYSYPTCEVENNNLKPAYDAAVQCWGDPWRMPTKAEFDELVTNCTSTYTTQSGVYGMLFTSKKEGYTDKSIFLPASGYGFQPSIYQFGTGCRYWSSTVVDTNYASHLRYDGTLSICNEARGGGQSIRPVCPKN